MNSYVYVIGSDGLPHVKIGTSINPQRRLQQLQPHVPVRLSVLWTIPGDHTLERRIHAHLDAYRTHGEWFDLTPLGDPTMVVQEAVRAVQVGPPCSAATGCTEPDSCYGGPCLHVFMASVTRRSQ